MSGDEDTVSPSTALKVVLVVDGTPASLQVQEALKGMAGVKVVPLEELSEDSPPNFDVKGKFERTKAPVTGTPRVILGASQRFGQLAALALMASAMAEPAQAHSAAARRPREPLAELIPVPRREKGKSGLHKPPKKLGPKPQRGYGGPRR